MRIYVASSWRNPLQPIIVQALRELGHEVYDFRNPAPGNHGFSWNQIMPMAMAAGGGHVYADTYLEMLRHPLAAAAYKSDRDALRNAEAVMYVLPCGQSASWELGYAAGMGKPTYVVWFGKHAPELMFREATIIASIDELRALFAPRAGFSLAAAGACCYERCTSTATHGPGDVPVVCWRHAGDFPKIEARSEVAVATEANARCDNYEPIDDEGGNLCRNCGGKSHHHGEPR